MKNLLYKEFTLVVTPLIYAMLILFGVFALIPNYPSGVSFFYIMAIYPMLFMGTNKGTQTNDLYFSLTLPAKRKQIVLARLITVITCQLTLTASTCIFTPIGTAITNSINASSQGQVPPSISLGVEGMMATVGFSFVSFSAFNIVFFYLFYKDGKKFALPYILGLIPFIILTTVLIVVLPGALPEYMTIFGKWNAGIQIGTLLGCLLVGGVINFFAYLLGTKSFEKADF